jgi:hypothetical protein
MSSKREAVLVAVTALVVAALPGADVARNRTAAIRLGPGGAVTVDDGDPGEPEVDFGLGAPVYNYSHRIGLAFAAGDATTVDALMRALGAAVEADRTLGGLVDYLQTVAPDGEALDIAGADAASQASAGLIADYSTTSPL